MQLDLQHDEFDDMFETKDPQIRISVSPKKVNNKSLLIPVDTQVFREKDSKFLRSLEEVLTWEKPQNTVLDQLANMIQIGKQPELTQLNDLKTMNQHLDWKMKQNNAKKLELKRKQRQRELEEIQRQNHLIWKQEQRSLNLAKQQAQDRMKCNTFITSDSEIRNEQNHRRKITLDYGSDSITDKMGSMTKMRQSMNINFYKKLSNTSPSKISEGSITTAATSNRHSNAPSVSPNKLRRNIRQIAQDSVQYLNFTAPVSPASRRPPKAPKIQTENISQSISPSTKQREQVPSQNIFRIQIKSSKQNPRINTAISHSPNKRNRKCFQIKPELKQDNENTQVSSLFSNSILSSLPIIQFNGKSQCLSTSTLENE